MKFVHHLLQGQVEDVFFVTGQEVGVNAVRLAVVQVFGAELDEFVVLLDGHRRVGA